MRHSRVSKCFSKVRSKSPSKYTVSRRNGQVARVSNTAAIIIRLRLVFYKQRNHQQILDGSDSGSDDEEDCEHQIDAQEDAEAWLYI